MMIYKKKIYWVLYIYIVSVIGLLIWTRIQFPPEYFQFNIYTNTFLALNFGIILSIQIVRATQKIIIKESGIESVGFLSKHNLKVDQIKGYEMYYWLHNSRPIKYILIKSNSKLKKDIKIHPSYIRFDEILRWTQTNFINLDKVNEDENRANILENSKYGANRTERENFVTIAGKTTDILNGIGFILVLFIYFPSTFSFILFPALLIPILAFCATFYFKGLVKIIYLSRYAWSKVSYQNKKQEHNYDNTSYITDVILAIVLPLIVLFSIADESYVMMEELNLFQPIFISSVVLLIVYFIRTKDFEFKSVMSYFNPFVILLCFYAYFHFTIVHLNCFLDTSEPTTHTTFIEEKRIEYNGHDINEPPKYTITIKSTEHTKRLFKKVPKDEYETFKEGDPYALKINQGKFGIPWISKEKKK